MNHGSIITISQKKPKPTNAIFCVGYTQQKKINLNCILKINVYEIINNKSFFQHKCIELQNLRLNILKLDANSESRLCNTILKAAEKILCGTFTFLLHISI